jgi:hypothetical protein
MSPGWLPLDGAGLELLLFHPVNCGVDDRSDDVFGPPFK